MANIMLYGAPGVHGIPSEALGWLQTYAQQGHEIIMGDSKTGDAKLHRNLSSIGLNDKVTIYTMKNASLIDNSYGLKVRQFDTAYDSENKKVYVTDHNSDVALIEIDGVEKESDIELKRDWYEFKDKQLVKDCSLAILILNSGDETSKKVQQLIMALNIREKPCYVFKV